MRQRSGIAMLAAPLLFALALLAAAPHHRLSPEKPADRAAVGDVEMPVLVTLTPAGPPDAAGNVRLLVHLPLGDVTGTVTLAYRLPPNVAVQKMPRRTTGTAASLRGTTQELVVRPTGSGPAPVYVTVDVGGVHVTAGTVLNPAPPEPDRGSLRTTSDGRRLHLYPGEARP